MKIGNDMEREINYENKDEVAAEYKRLRELPPAPGGVINPWRMSAFLADYQKQEEDKANLEKQEEDKENLEKQEQNKADFLAAAKSGDLETVKTLKSCTDLNCVDEQGRTALHCAALRGHGEVADYLLSEGADPKVKDKQGRTAVLLLHMLAQEGGLGTAAKVKIR